MPRLMSVTLTKEAVIARRKTETRRLGWLHAKVGDELDLCEKVMGRKKGDPLVKLARVRIVEVYRERLDAITDTEVHREGFTANDLRGWALLDPRHHAPGHLAEAFVAYFCHHMKCDHDTLVTVIRWEYL